MIYCKYTHCEFNTNKSTVPFTVIGFSLDVGMLPQCFDVSGAASTNINQPFGQRKNLNRIFFLFLLAFPGTHLLLPVVVLYVQAVGTKEWREVSYATLFFSSIKLSARYVCILPGELCNECQLSDFVSGIREGVIKI